MNQDFPAFSKAVNPLHAIPMRPIYILIIIAVTLASCFRDVHRSLYIGELQNQESYEIKSMAGCCGCRALYYNSIKNQIIAEQFVVETNCGLYEPTKHIFTTDAKGKVSSFKSYVAVTDSNFTISVSDKDKAAFQKLDSIYQTWTSPTKRKIVIKDIKGFKEGGKTHFPVGVEIPKALKYGM